MTVARALQQRARRLRRSHFASFKVCEGLLELLTAKPRCPAIQITSVSLRRFVASSENRPVHIDGRKLKPGYPRTIRRFLTVGRSGISSPSTIDDSSGVRTDQVLHAIARTPSPPRC